MQKADPQNVNLPIVHRASYAGIIRIRFEGFRGRVPFSQPGIPSSPFSIVIIVFRRGKVKSPGGAFSYMRKSGKLVRVCFFDHAQLLIAALTHFLLYAEDK